MGTNCPSTLSRPSQSSDSALRAPTPPSICMEQELERFLSKVRNRQGTVGIKAGKEPPNLKKWGSDKLRITVYEIANSEQLDPAWGRGRKRKVK